ncbi:short chain dehydrogenase [Azotobacter beijerinckii]|uniref:Short chain dehydrogenase n=1 Tax=Azotobacter beijerinckii TaxID=170623 RepID=A0A1H6U882_9GAMM|nr:SDR family oxidoreductase [Azotobacter beijerinckii]SEI88588.1 short chain dehydrogenase [Azotobacter beijerinckii]
MRIVPMGLSRSADKADISASISSSCGATDCSSLSPTSVGETVRELRASRRAPSFVSNVKGVLNGVAAVLPEFIAQKSGHVIATSSVAGLKAYPGGAVYGGTKWFVRDFMEVLRMESAMEGTRIRTATIYPAAINTELLTTIKDKASLDQMQGIYDTYGISPDRIASVVAFAIDQPEDTTINEFTVGPANQPW